MDVVRDKYANNKPIKKNMAWLAKAIEWMAILVSSAFSPLIPKIVNPRTHNPSTVPNPPTDLIGIINPPIPMLLKNANSERPRLIP